MKYFKNISHIEQAKQHYRQLAKQLHPDKGGSQQEFNQMQQEYKTLLLQLHQSSKQGQKQELIYELKKMAQTILDKQIPQNILKNKIERTKPGIQRKIFSELVNLMDKIKLQ